MNSLDLAYENLLKAKNILLLLEDLIREAHRMRLPEEDCKRLSDLAVDVYDLTNSLHDVRKTLKHIVLKDSVRNQNET